MGVNLTFERAESAGRVAPKGRISRPGGLGETRSLHFDRLSTRVSIRLRLLNQRSLALS